MTTYQHTRRVFDFPDLPLTLSTVDISIFMYYDNGNNRAGRVKRCGPNKVAKCRNTEVWKTRSRGVEEGNPFMTGLFDGGVAQRFGAAGPVVSSEWVLATIDLPIVAGVQRRVTSRWWAPALIWHLIAIAVWKNPLVSYSRSSSFLIAISHLPSQNNNIVATIYVTNKWTSDSTIFEEWDWERTDIQYCLRHVLVQFCNQLNFNYV